MAQQRPYYDVPHVTDYPARTSRSGLKRSRGDGSSSLERGGGGASASAMIIMDDDHCMCQTRRHEYEVAIAGTRAIRVTVRRERTSRGRTCERSC